MKHPLPLAVTPTYLLPREALSLTMPTCLVNVLEPPKITLISTSSPQPTRTRRAPAVRVQLTRERPVRPKLYSSGMTVPAAKSRRPERRALALANQQAEATQCTGGVPCAAGTTTLEGTRPPRCPRSKPLRLHNLPYRHVRMKLHGRHPSPRTLPNDNHRAVPSSAWLPCAHRGYTACTESPQKCKRISSLPGRSPASNQHLTRGRIRSQLVLRLHPIWWPV